MPTALFVLIRISVGIGALPSPGILAHFFNSSFSFPMKLFERFARVAVAGCDIAGTAGLDGIGDLNSAWITGV